MFVRRRGSEHQDEPEPSSLVVFTFNIQDSWVQRWWPIGLRPLRTWVCDDRWWDLLRWMVSLGGFSLCKGVASAIRRLTVNLTHCHYHTIHTFRTLYLASAALQTFLAIKLKLEPTPHFVRSISTGSNIVNMSLCICLVLTNWICPKTPLKPPQIAKSVIPPKNPQPQTQKLQPSTPSTFSS